MDADTDRRIGAIEVKQKARDARCAACIDRMRREVAMARSVRRLAAAATLLAVVLAVAMLAMA